MDFGEIGKKIYDISKSREFRRYVIFRVRCILNRRRMKRLWDYFHSASVLAKTAPSGNMIFYRRFCLDGFILRESML